MKRHIVLVGLPGAGKSAVGAHVAQALGAPFHDGDVLIATHVGKPVARIFAEDGEAAFRAHERTLVTEVLNGPPAVIAPGGGWAAHPGNLQIAGNALVVHLAVEPQVALSRIGGQIRPVLGGDPKRGMERLARDRFPLYMQAEATVRTDNLGVPEVADLVVRLARSVGGW